MPSEDAVVVDAADESLLAARSRIGILMQLDGLAQAERPAKRFQVQDHVEVDPMAAVRSPRLAGEGDRASRGNEMVLQGPEVFTDMGRHERQGYRIGGPFSRNSFLPAHFFEFFPPFW